MIDHMGFAVVNLDRAKNFYVNALKPLGLRARQETTESGARWGIPKFGIVSYARACSMLL
jgi:catechol 2,3-dioxygenase-like lactoylglutathione lyase family enzyme